MLPTVTPQEVINKLSAKLRVIFSAAALLACFQIASATSSLPSTASAPLVTPASSVTPATSSTVTKATSSTKQTLVPPARRQVPGTHLQLTSATLYVPDFFTTRPSPVAANKLATQATATQALIFFHGASWVAEQNFYDSHKNAVLISISLPMDKYGSAMAQPGALDRILAEADSKLTDADITSAPISRLCISSFSGGYGAVREILASRVRSQQITDVVLADSLYGPHVPGNETQLETTATQPFLDFARAAAEGRDNKHFFFSQLFPPEEKYRTNTTTIAAYYLTDTLAIPRKPTVAKSSRGAHILYRADKNGFHVFGYAGMTTQDHFDHYYGISDLWKQTSLDDVQP